MPTTRRVARVLTLTAVALLLASVGAASASAALPLRGVQLHSMWWDSTNADMDRELDLAAQANSNVVRVDVGWGNLEESGKGQFTQWYVDKLDRFMAGAQARGMKVIATLWATPCWASSAPDTLRQGCADNSWWGRGVQAYPPTNPQDYADIARWMTARYGAKLAALEVWNEPNLANRSFWNSANPAADYARLLRAAYPAAKAGNPDVPVIGGSLSGSDRSFLSQLYANGVKGYEDGLSVHPYADPGFNQLNNLHSDMTAAGDNTPVWVTEFGWPTGSDPQWHVTEAEQATDVTQGFADLGNRPWVQGASLYNLRDKGTDATSMEDNFGVLRRDYTPKPAYAALTAALAAQAAGGTTGGGGTGGGTTGGGTTGGTTGGGTTGGTTSGGGATVPTAPTGGTTSGGSLPVVTAQTTSTAPSTSGGGSRRRVSVRVVRRSGRAFASGQTDARGKVRLSLRRCGGRTAATLTVRADASGRFERLLGAARRLRSCRVAAAPAA